MADTDDTKIPDSKSPDTRALAAPAVTTSAPTRPAAPPLPPEIGGPKGPEPTRFGDWEQKGRATDF